MELTPLLFFRQGILDVFLAVIAKALVVQIKAKGEMKQSSPPDGNGKFGMTSVTLASVEPQKSPDRWWLRGASSNKLADLIITFMRDMTLGKVSDTWQRVSKGAIAENIIQLTRLEEKEKSNLITCLSTPTLWMALASLCVLHPEHIDALSSKPWRSNDPNLDLKEYSKVSSSFDFIVVF